MKYVYSCLVGVITGSEICGTLFCVGCGLNDRSDKACYHVMAVGCDPCRAVHAVGSAPV